MLLNYPCQTAVIEESNTGLGFGKAIPADAAYCTCLLIRYQKIINVQMADKIQS